MRAAMEVQISQLENALAAALENNGQLSKQIEMEHRHSIQLEEKCIELEIQYEQSTSHNLRTIAERDNYKLRVGELELHLNEKEKNYEGEVESGCVEPWTSRKGKVRSGSQHAGSARTSLQDAHNVSKKEKRRKQESLEAMSRLHSVLKAATQVLDSDGQNDKPSGIPDIALDSGAEELLSRMMV